jgi:hypothetical protein
MSFGLYVLGYIIVIAGVAWGLSVAGLSSRYIAIIAVIMIGMAIVTGVSRTRMKDPPA